MWNRNNKLSLHRTGVVGEASNRLLNAQYARIPWHVRETGFWRIATGLMQIRGQTYGTVNGRNHRA